MQALLDAASSFLRHCPLVSATLPCFGTLVTVAMRCAAHPEAATAIAALRFLSLLANMPQACGAVVGEPPQQQQEGGSAAAPFLAAAARNGNKWAFAASAINGQLAIHGAALVQLLVAAAGGGAPDFLVEPVGGALAGLLHSASCAGAVRGALAAHAPAHFAQRGFSRAAALRLSNQQQGHCGAETAPDAANVAAAQAHALAAANTVVGALCAVPPPPFNDVRRIVQDTWNVSTGRAQIDVLVAHATTN